MKYVLTEIGHIPDGARDTLCRKLEERNAPLGEILNEDEIPSEFNRFAPGQIFGAHKETIIRREVRRTGTPIWFDPMTVPGHFGFVSEDGLRCYIEVEVDCVARNLPSTFETRIAGLVEDDPVQLGLMASG